MMLDDEPVVTHAPIALNEAPADPGMRESNVFCSKIITTNASSASRFQCSQRVHKILEYNGVAGDGPGALMRNDAGAGAWAWPAPRPRPLSSPYPCFNCHRLFTGPPIFLPERLLNDEFEEDLNFCSGPCMNTYIHVNLNDAMFAQRSANALEYMRKVHGFTGAELGLAPHFSQHVRYGGELTDAQFDAIIGTPQLSTHIRKVPFIPSRTVIEWTCSVDADDGDVKQRQLHADLMRVQESLRSHAATATPADAAASMEYPQMSLEQNLAAASQSNPSLASQVLDSVMGHSATVPPHHRCWQTQNLRQPPLEAIEKRLAALPPLEKRTGAYEMYLEAKGGFDDDAAAPPLSVADAAAAITAAVEAVAIPASKKARTMARRKTPAAAAAAAASATATAATDDGPADAAMAEAAPAPKSRPLLSVVPKRTRRATKMNS